MPSVGAVTSNLSVTTKTADYTAVANDFVLMNATSGARTVTLPIAPVVNTLVAVKKNDSSTNAVSVVPGGSANINGDTSMILPANGSSATLQYDGTNWQLLNTGMPNAANASAGIPSGGTAGQVLTKASASNYDANWATASAGGGTSGSNYFPWQGTGRYFHMPFSRAQYLAGYPPYNTIFVPVRVPNACTLTEMSFYVVSASGVTANISLYTDVGGAVSSAGPGVKISGAAVFLNSGALSKLPLNYAVTQPMNLWACFCWSAVSTITFACTTISNTTSNWTPASGSTISTTWAVAPRMSNAYTPNGSIPPDIMTTVATTQVTADSVPIPFFTVAS